MDDFFGDADSTNQQQSEPSQQLSQDGSSQQLSPQGTPQGSSNNIDSMLAGSDDDDLFSPPQQQQQQSHDEEEPLNSGPTALDKWRDEKQNELRELDQKESQQNSELAKEAREKLDNFYKTLKESQESRAKHNLEVDQEFIQDRDSTTTKPWERVVSFIDFNRSDLHERDIQRMKSLLLQLKH